MNQIIKESFFFVSRRIAWIYRDTYAQIYKHIYTNHIIKARYHKKRSPKMQITLSKKNMNQNINFFFVSRWIAWSTRNTYAQIYKHIFTNHIIKTRYHKNKNHVIKTNTQIRYEFVTKETLLSRPRICEKRDITQIRITLSNQNLRSNFRTIVWAGTGWPRNALSL